MNPNLFSWDLFDKAPIVGIVRNLTLEELKIILPLYREVGLTTIEITMNTPQAAELIAYAVDHESEGLNIGAGTVCTEADLKVALAAGAQFIVTPIIAPKVIKKCVKKNIPVFPGAFTPTEIYKAWDLGAPMVKVFPATALGPSFISDLKGPLQQIKLLPTGGVNLENIREFKRAGADGYGLASQLFNKTMIAQRDWEALKRHFSQHLEMLA
ncbi:2-dehydro-3-deoxyphosphogluconate aldolase/(4S)-4-hydroxy-2-oxoglutarate aldolase [Dyadobacter jejuensis]|uniref:2-dehydro-3-deoxyphosphogluconate aldolase/(4S)-4-hydroxy-2-oxoglutarate aldolase n=1 Tax=Dyadobacter jejuensis TaxID=1082580 RepID=A0A316AU76_9BACT|nr:bifunctional 4-hydroxy-2-oxoglutarate aldolase/2-dehydro-3-deoxy-phosphogluconate aldolase [Dyadobacter jejuensis]PWJ60240.1 2-dehydro-3-deoxyphosphogluconate aldolase/(4S)-4-hydroxy-2-oxoglutarate aldolase [Dyadobacter jejuensis]